MARSSCHREDVGRHNAVDKVVGALLLDGGLPPAQPLGLFVSGRALDRDGPEGLGRRLPARSLPSAHRPRSPSRQPAPRTSRSSASSAPTASTSTAPPERSTDGKSPWHIRRRTLDAMIFADRVEAGQRLAQALDRFRGPDVVVLGLPRGGVPVARQVADVARRTARRRRRPQARRAVAPGAGDGSDRGGRGPRRQPRHRPIGGRDRRGHRRRRSWSSGPNWSGGRGGSAATGDRADLDRQDRHRRRRRHRHGCDRHAPRVRWCAALGATRIVLATPVAPPGLERRLADVADEFVCLDQPRRLRRRRPVLRDFDQTTDAEVIAALSRWRVAVNLRSAWRPPSYHRPDDRS